MSVSGRRPLGKGKKSPSHRPEEDLFEALEIAKKRRDSSHSSPSSSAPLSRAKPFGKTLAGILFLSAVLGLAAWQGYVYFTAEVDRNLASEIDEDLEMEKGLQEESEHSGSAPLRAPRPHQRNPSSVSTGAAQRDEESLEDYRQRIRENRGDDNHGTADTAPPPSPYENREPAFAEDHKPFEPQPLPADQVAPLHPEDEDAYQEEPPAHEE